MNTKTKSVAFGFDLAALVPDYEVDGKLWLSRHYEGGYLYRELILVEATPKAELPGGWKLNYGFQSETPNVANEEADVKQQPGYFAFTIPVISPKNRTPGIAANLRIELRRWND